jgi:DNA-binding response OmpR family regulator
VMGGHLSSHGYQVDGFSCAEELDDYFARQTADLLILDVNLPGENGFSIAQRYRAAYPQIHIIMLTVRGSTTERVNGYDSGADLYMAKPVSSEELSAAVASIERRIRHRDSVDARPEMDLQRLVLRWQDAEVPLTQVEAVLLKGLIEAGDNKLDYWRMIELLGMDVTEKSKGALGVYVHRLSRKLSALGLKDPAIRSLWKEGYQLTQKISLM